MWRTATENGTGARQLAAARPYRHQSPFSKMWYCEKYHCQIQFEKALSVRMFLILRLPHGKPNSWNCCQIYFVLREFGCLYQQVIALEQLGKLRHLGKGRQVRRLEEQIKCFADVVQSGMPTLGFTEIASVLGVIQNRSGYETLLLFVANRIVSGGIDLAKEAQTCSPETVAVLVKCMMSSGQRDMMLFRQLSNLVQLIPHDRFTLGSLAEVTESFLPVNKDQGLMRFVGAVLQQLDLSSTPPEDVAAMLSALSKAQVQDEVSFRRLSRAVLLLPDAVFAPAPTGVILNAFARAKFRDLALFRKLSAVALQQEPTEFSSDDILHVVTAAAAFGSDSKAKALMNHMDTALLATGKNDLSPQHIGIIAASYAEVGGPSDPQVLVRLSAAALALEPWVLDIQAMAYIVKVLVQRITVMLQKNKLGMCGWWDSISRNYLKTRVWLS